MKFIDKIPTYKYNTPATFHLVVLAFVPIYMNDAKENPMHESTIHHELRISQIKPRLVTDIFSPS